MENQAMPRIVIAAPKGRSGKTTVTMGLLAALTNLGEKVQPFKKGPDYIDPSWMTAITGRPCCNLDAVLMTKDIIIDSFATNAQGADLSIIEGAMGLYDGLDLEGSGSTAQIAKILSAPVVLVVDCTRMTRSVAATVLGYQQFDREINIDGVILNKVGSSRHERILRGAIEAYCQVQVLGSIPKSADLTIPDRHLGLIPASERGGVAETIRKIGQVIGDSVDLALFKKLAGESSPLHLSSRISSSTMLAAIQGHNGFHADEKITIGVIRDRVFSFYYPENLRQLEAEGAKLVFLNSLSDRSIGHIDGLYIGGGFPELFGPQLEKNREFRHSIITAINHGLPVYAECGGLMYLGRKLYYQEQEWAMVGALPFDVVMERKPQGHGYTVMHVIEPNGCFDQGEVIKGHEFHHSRLVNLDESKISYALQVERGTGIDGLKDGIVYKNVFAAYNHIHGMAYPQWARNFVRQSYQYRNLPTHSAI